jgi:hypothetical protein
MMVAETSGLSYAHEHFPKGLGDKTRTVKGSIRDSKPGRKKRSALFGLTWKCSQRHIPVTDMDESVWIRGQPKDPYGARI